MLEFRKYGPAPAEEKDPPMCVVTYPASCGRPAVGEVYALSFCEAHGNEAHIAARLEASEDAEKVLDRLMIGAEGEHAVRNPLVYEALKGITFPPHGFNLNHAEAIRAAYVLRESDTDPDTLAYDYDGDPGGGPYDWWCEAREMVVGFMREAHEAGQPHLLASLEPIREHASVQQELALDDMNRRWVAPRRAACEERRKREAECDPSGQILGTVNGKLGSAIDLLDDVPPEAFGDDYFRTKGAIAEAGGLVVRAQARQVEEAGDQPA